MCHHSLQDLNTYVLGRTRLRLCFITGANVTLPLTLI
jgi:hypothetical protein